MAIADHFVDTYCVVENPHRCFLQLPTLNEHKFMRDDPEKYLFQENCKHNKVFDYEGFIPSCTIRYRFINAIRRCEDNVPRIFILLNQLFREEAIKLLFPDVWTMWHNVMMRKANTHERNEMNRQRKHVPKKERVMHHQCERITHGMSMRDAARQSRIFT